MYCYVIIPVMVSYISTILPWSTVAVWSFSISIRPNKYDRGPIIKKSFSGCTPLGFQLSTGWIAPVDSVHFGLYLGDTAACAGALCPSPANRLQWHPESRKAPVSPWVLVDDGEQLICNVLQSSTYQKNQENCSNMFKSTDQTCL